MGMYVCMHACMDVCMYLHIHVYAYVYTQPANQPNHSDFRLEQLSFRPLFSRAGASSGAMVKKIHVEKAKSDKSSCKKCQKILGQ